MYWEGLVQILGNISPVSILPGRLKNPEVSQLYWILLWTSRETTPKKNMDSSRLGPPKELIEWTTRMFHLFWVIFGCISVLFSVISRAETKWNKWTISKAKFRKLQMWGRFFWISAERWVVFVTWSMDDRMLESSWSNVKWGKQSWSQNGIFIGQNWPCKKNINNLGAAGLVRGLLSTRWAPSAVINGLITPISRVKKNNAGIPFFFRPSIRGPPVTPLINLGKL